jgi:S-adenosylmethionine:tRNA ribosyltransferase-isomerase
MTIPRINIEDYSYQLPEGRIAQYPVKVRDRSKLLIYSNGEIKDETFSNIARHIPAGTLMVFNNTKVIRARFLFAKDTGARIEVFCLEPLTPADYEQSFASCRQVEWKCLIGNLKKWKKGRLCMEFRVNGENINLCAERKEALGEAWRVNLSWDNERISFSEVAEAAGHIPLPPYIRREDENDDNIWYQTVYSRVDGSVAAPTAGLHFTGSVLEALINKGIRRCDLTLHIGAGTFKPVKTDEISKHEMHCEHFVATRELIDTLLKYKGRILAVGTTSVRTLESLYWTGVRLIDQPVPASFLHTDQWEPYGRDRGISLDDSLEALRIHMERTGNEVVHGSTELIIVPGYRFRVINGMITNFHQPRSTLLLLVAAFAGDDWEKIYQHALNSGYRFLSFGDATLLPGNNLTVNSI